MLYLFWLFFWIMAVLMIGGLIAISLTDYHD